MDRDLLRNSVDAFGVVLTDAQLDAFDLLSAELQRWNKQINLTALRSDDDITIKHFVDSLRLVPALESGLRLLDIGSGAGFPALPLAIARPDLAVTSIDAVAKKTSFQRHICRLLKLESFEALHGRVENLAQEKPGYYDVVTSRAFSSLALFISLGSPLIQDRGKLIAMRGDDQESTQKDHMTLLESAGFGLEEIVRYSLPRKKGQRCLLIARKAA